MKVGLLISSFKTYAEARIRLLDSAAYIPSDRIQVVIGGCEKEHTYFGTNGVIHREVTHNSYDHTACIDPVLPEDWTHVFLLHDTMELAIDSYDLICAVDPDVHATAAHNGQCNLMLVRRDWLEQAQPVLQTFKNCTKSAAVGSEGWLWHQAPTRAQYSKSGYCNIEAPHPVFGGAERVTELYESVGIKKFKGNWECKSEADYVKTL